MNVSMSIRFTLFTTAFLALSMTGSAQADLERIPTETARAVVGASSGVVLVDLYAEW